ncbi:DUF3307 domain-containing protein [Geotoga petraea]|uniref:DUF3307 domain-containing protein n=1 Tax=Geotoga petraea TaxID=28234 RepID=A0A1G6P4Y8_9BACT|nr:DUF3307 domain-containing protein [Geotoga petraea]SDC75233.1 Protein of unknown function [Geotoga petraea]
MINNIFFLFLLSHLIGDYVFQTSYIAKYKVSKLSVLLLHIFIIFISMFLLFLPSSLNLYNLLLLVILTFVHLLIDILKYKNRDKKMFNTSEYYVLDQFMHFSSLMIVSLIYNQTEFFINFDLAKVISLGLFNAYFIGLLFYMFKGSKKAYKRDYLGYLLRFSLPIIKYYSNTFFLIFSLIFVLTTIYLAKKNEESIKIELGPLAMSVIITYLSIWR